MSSELRQYLKEGLNLYARINDVTLVQVNRNKCEIKVKNQNIWVCWLFDGDPYELSDWVRELIS